MAIFIGGRRRQPLSETTLDLADPATGLVTASGRWSKRKSLAGGGRVAVVRLEEAHEVGPHVAPEALAGAAGLE
ncbi:hypothetical protein GCM10012280_64730 [Wenjunlia tyrosinilytica]|uniref:Uncharacterized protein n=1 Tax=Wenjunlia tyrosinilytica TaxID=1544741 RepID=A0A917ZWG8_9ACTN|nr:hypothetical protein GCM10012280_64730 [Wenjunlia tyrosinilytica]